MDILTHKADGITTIQFNRPQRKNAITMAMYVTMAEAILDAERDPAVRAIVFLGQPEIYTAGNDLEDFLKGIVPSAGAQEVPAVFQFMRALHGATKPVVAAVAGAAVGIGTTMLLHCDLVYAAENAQFSMPFTQLGLCPEFASSVLFPQLAGYPRAAEKLMLGEAFSAQEALAMGLVSRILTVTELAPFALAQAARLAALPPASIRTTKRLMRASRAAAVADIMQEENKLFGEMLAAPEAKEAFTAFFEKRKPDFKQFC